MVATTKAQIGKNFQNTKRTPSTGNFKYWQGKMINNWCPVAKPKDCGEIDPAHCQSGVYTIFPPGLKPFDVYCKLTNQGKAWTVIQRRFDGKIDFYRTWKEYEHGFGNLKGEHWLGNDKIHILTSGGGYFELRIDLADFDGETRYALYRKFAVGNAGSKYKLVVGGYSGNAGDCLSGHNGRLFSTPDQDNDTSKSNCADVNKGAYWYYKCYQSNLNGAYLKGETARKYQGMVWPCWRGYSYSLKSTTLMIRRL
ncbi:Angiopoietin-related protein 1,Ficolin-1-A,Angiopoietin-1,Fibrinogen C domain-containing protein 1,Ryncolin-1,Tenascin-N,Angiopoietin-related protein 7,Angiopoietin-related protein 6,Ficolin-3,Fibrinogen C domain-containing protein 1-B,Fibroleukin,Fibrinogen-like protein 1,Ficolin-1,Ficolin-1-B,Angiopoietin-4,Tenascin-R,Ryncolin-2,Techylectin-5B,Fibrinogen C domain-containing protein 1-A,Microfibril-associated glycoprotein 4,Fibrinogen-like protein A,Ryncolin-3,Angiopoietin-2,Tenascin-X,Ficolin-2,Tenascin|uniref:Fibrinogen C-terminal domain-containing protein n=1 Tax=Mytilus edulis TaxID=6550 RepID=A0A8S3UKR6_MYTED|nr:Angiopoietin-related protein 1,Ficolin-1-A,Angiopoietin-1,Fibrinogen C domain-containing protein 1,Ryncolin-1,Tenascin-N,Angiopoietin-related protein 7,Angiopoietin-related protein 6,Ficolin-3,Fibrinogen C domain-containing protein 1-B,Fibroleukin,Fibrinogen-like protein 1,Ficolin-1,Ficolin-1-B,Angiopoietin-4,Tenascin-R,Ryncolin-2,Techylectin-5B,Fibrinogen C domain-containing protein 1-A,Microfibril-associated glycoprotein 4,Fibrinogen-like protein A,Ryncolin-3,Angiopoietin-2,Tenascin-X,Ficolin-